MQSPLSTLRVILICEIVVARRSIFSPVAIVAGPQFRPKPHFQYEVSHREPCGRVDFAQKAAGSVAGLGYCVHPINPALPDIFTISAISSAVRGSDCAKSAGFPGSTGEGVRHSDHLPHR